MSTFLEGIRVSGSLNRHNNFETVSLDQLQLVGWKANRRGFTNEIKPEEYRCGAIPLFHPSIHSAQRAILDLDPTSRPNLWRNPYIQSQLEDSQNVAELLGEGGLIVNCKETGHVSVRGCAVLLLGQQLQEDVIGKQRLLEGYGLAAILMH